VNEVDANDPLWTPSPERVAGANVTAFMRAVEAEFAAPIPDYAALARWSVAEPEKFWRAVWSFSGVIAETQGEVTLRDGDAMPGAHFFPEARLNFAENLLRRRDSETAIVFRCEDRARRTLSFAELYDAVSVLSQALAAAGVAQGDRVAGYLPNAPETVIAMLAAASLGAIWSSCSPDFGVEGVLDRFGQIAPKVLFAADGYLYGGRHFDLRERLERIGAGLPATMRLIVVPFAEDSPRLDGLDGAVALPAFTAEFAPADIAFEQFPFNHPLFIMYSSGTTGVPKCIVHGAGGTLLKHLCEHRLHTDVKRGDRLFYATTCGWMMWNWLVSGLASEASLLLYDGAPFHPDAHALFAFAEAEAMTIFGTSAKYLDAVAKSGIEPGACHDLGALKTILSTGSPLAPASFEFVYAKIKRDVCLSSISGGTDIIGCFALGNPIGPVWPGELQSRALGLAVAVFDESGRAVRGRQGELVCTAPFPSMPVGFWDDPGDVRYRAAYFETYPGVWCHGDFVELTEHDGLIMYGRSDAVLNPGGVRIGTAEIYRQVEAMDAVVEAIAVGQSWQGDQRVVLFVRLRPGVALDAALADAIKARIRHNLTPRHVPAKVIAVADIPRTVSGKITELAVREVIHRRPVKNRAALANPEALDLFAGLPELQT
jgi:acetoacetyl-CoA synthetase